MAEIRLSKKQQITFLIPEEEGDGVRKVAQKVAKDVENTTGLHPSLAPTERNMEQAVIAVTAGNGKMAKLLQEGIPELQNLEGKWEAYGFYLAE